MIEFAPLEAKLDGGRDHYSFPPPSPGRILHDWNSDDWSFMYINEALIQ